jgi:hypothetical protein
MERLYPGLEDIWKDAEGNYLDITDEDRLVIISMINRAYDRGCNHGAISAKAV